MNMTLPQTEELLNGLKQRVRTGEAVEVVVAPPFTSLVTARSILQGTPIGLAAQNMYAEDFGPYTGEISAPMLVSAGCGWVIIGHSERRQHFGEMDSLINRKIKKALEHGLKVIFCVGETLAERQGGRTEDVVHRQLLQGLDEVPEASMKQVVIAYEPVWAIGTGNTATPEQAQEMHRLIRQWLADLYSPQTAQALRIVYGGSVNAANCRDLLSQPDIDGALVGGASLDVDSFCAIIGWSD